MVPSTSVTFVSKASIDSGVVKSYNLRKRVEAVKNCRNITKKDMKYNDAMPKMKVDPERYVSANLQCLRNFGTEYIANVVNPDC
jgi:urease